MKRSKNNHMDESEVFKRKTLNAAKRRKKMAIHLRVSMHLRIVGGSFCDLELHALMG